MVTLSKLKKIIPFLVLLLVTAIFYHKLAFSNLIIARGDTFSYFYPYWHQAASALKSGEIPLWNPNIFMGSPFIANSQVGFFYPLNLILWLIFPTPYAVSASTLIHIMIASFGTYLAARRCLSLGVIPSLVAAVLFAFGGYATSKVEHVNQLQGMAWIPWYLVVLCAWWPAGNDWRKAGKLVAAMSVLFALQLLAGHTQTAFITFVGLAAWLIARGFLITSDSAEEPRGRPILNRVVAFAITLIPLLLAGVLAVMLSSIQLIPTYELSRYSSRQGGLPINEALSFSLHPLLISQSLLPAIDRTLNPEYVAYMPIAALLLAIVAIWSWRKNQAVRPVILLALLGLFLAFGHFNPFSHLLVRLPGFNLFRVQARWIVLYTFAIALLAGAGFELVTNHGLKQIGIHRRSLINNPLLVGILLIIFIFIWAFLAVPFARIVPVGSLDAVEWPTIRTMLGWITELFLATLVLLGLLGLIRYQRIRQAILIVLILVVMSFSFLSLPVSEPTTPEAFFDVRPPVAQLQAMTECASTSADCELVDGRVLSLSNIFFDVGDQKEIDAIYADQLTKTAQRDYTVAIKQKEILGPNLPMNYDLASVDGYDGGVLPLHSYSQLSRLIMPGGEQTTDGRLRENLESVPEQRWLNLFNTRYLITDKVGDVWRNEVFFDMQHPSIITAEGQAVSVGYIPSYEATELWMIVDGQPGYVELGKVDGQHLKLEPERLDQDLYRVSWDQPAFVQSIDLHPCQISDISAVTCQNEWKILGMALVDRRDETFRALVPGSFRLVHSGDVKIYENLDVLPRAFMVDDWQFQPDEESALLAMQAPDFDPSVTAILVGEGPESGDKGRKGTVHIAEYDSERVVVNTDSITGGLLILTDANYPGWEASIDGDSAKVYSADVLFRGVMVPPGLHEITFVYDPDSFKIGRALTLIGLIILVILLAFIVVSARRSKREPV